MNSTAFLIMLATTSLLACGKTEEAAAPVPVPQAEPTLPLAEQMPVTPDEPAVSVIEPVSTTTSTQVPIAPVAAPKPTAVSAAPKAPTVAAATPPPPAASIQPDLAHGQQIYRQACAFCHDKGLAGAPKSADAAAWSPRLAQGMNTMYTSALQGKNAMPAKGGNPALTDADVTAAVDYLAAQAR